MFQIIHILRKPHNPARNTDLHLPLTSHRRIRPYGLAGGEDGQIGENWVRRNDGRMDRLKGADATVVDAGEAIIIQTPKLLLNPGETVAASAVLGGSTKAPS